MSKVKRILIYFLLVIIFIFVARTKVYGVENERARIYIDTPADNIEYIVKKELNIEGWVMSNAKKDNIKVYIDGEEQIIKSITRKERPDVIRAIIGWGTAEQNPKPGFETLIDCSKISDGKHSLSVRVYSDDGQILASNERKINIQKCVAKTYIDIPENKSKIKEKLEVEGWVMSDDTNMTIKAYLNGNEKNITSVTRKERPDVIKAIKGYGTIQQNPNPGYNFLIDTSDVKDGTYKLEIKIFSQNNELLTADARQVEIKKYSANSYIDSPTIQNKVKPMFNIIGWIMTDDEQSTVKVYIDGNEQKIKNNIREKRTDVINAISGYGGSNKNPNPGYTIQLENTNFSNGIHNLKVDVVSRENKIISTFSTRFEYEHYKAKTYIDSPSGDKITQYDDNFKVKGWVMSETENISIKAYIDGTEQEIRNLERIERTDVIKAIHGYGTITQNPKPGYEFMLNINRIKDGQHTLKLAIYDSKGRELEKTERKIEIKKYKATGCIDTPVPSGQARKALYVKGWIMTTDTNSTIKMYIDGKELNISSLIRVEREDVIKVIGGYGGIAANPRPGYKVDIDISDFSDGTYNFTVEAISNEGRVMYKENQKIIIYNKSEFGIDVSKHNGTIDWSKVKEAGINFAMIRAGNRGYGQPGNLVEDPKFVENMRGAISNEIKVGVYIYSQAITENEAIEEADLAVRLIRENGFSNNITYPIVIDTESSSGRADSLSSEQRTIIVRTFCERIKQHGYTPMIYANKWWLESSLDMNQLSNYDLWVAQYTGTTDPINDKSSYNGRHEIWQYTSSGMISGISGKFDLNICYKKYF